MKATLILASLLGFIAATSLSEAVNENNSILVEAERRQKQDGEPRPFHDMQNGGNHNQNGHTHLSEAKGKRSNGNRRRGGHRGRRGGHR